MYLPPNSLASLLSAVLAVAPEPDAASPSTDDASDEQPPPEPASEGEPTPAPSLPEGLELPRRVEGPTMQYPRSLLAETPPPEGEVVVRYTVGIDGAVLAASVVTPLHPKLDLLALENVLRSTHEPGRFEGQAVEVTTSITYDFVAPPPPPPAAKPEPELKPAPPKPTKPIPAPPVRARGVLLEAGAREPIAGASVIAIDGTGLDEGRVRPRASRRFRAAASSSAWTVEATTADDGTFELRGLPEGMTLLIFVVQGYDRLEYAVRIEKGTIVEGKYYQTRLNTNPYRTVVETEPETPAEVSRKVTKDEVAQAPGSQGDAVRGLLNFPGFARTPFGLGALVIRGAAPGDSAVYLGGHEIPSAFHFGGLTSTFNSELLDSIDYYPSNFDSRYGDATGGVVALGPRAPRDDGFHGHVDADVIDASALLEGPVGKGRYAVAARRSYLDLVLGAVGGVPIAPRYWDYQGLFDLSACQGGGLHEFVRSDRTTATSWSSAIRTRKAKRRTICATRSRRSSFVPPLRTCQYEKRVQGNVEVPRLTPSYRVRAVQGWVSFRSSTSTCSSHNVLDCGAEVERPVFQASTSWRIFGTEYVATWVGRIVDCGRRRRLTASGCCSLAGSTNDAATAVQRAGRAGRSRRSTPR